MAIKITEVQEPRKFLTPNDRIALAHFRFNCGYSIEQLCALHPAVNGGRISEAIKAIEHAANNPTKVRAYHETPPTRAKVRRPGNGAP